MNFERSAASFSPTTDESLREEIPNVLGVNKVSCHEKYLRLQTKLKRDKISYFQLIWEQCLRRGWKEKILSRVGKEILLKSIYQGLLH